MASFNLATRWVRDPTRPDPVRFLAFCWTLESYCWLTHQEFHATFRRLGHHLGFDWSTKPSASQMLEAVDILDRERSRFKVKLARVHRERRAEKALGRRQLPRRMYNERYDPDFLELSHPLVAA